MGGLDVELPLYDRLRASRRPLAKRILGLLLREGREFSHKELLEALGLKSEDKSKLSNNLDVLKNLNFVVREKRAPVRLKFRTPLCFVAGTPNVPYAYLGLLGVRDGWEVSETETALGVLGDLGISFERVVVASTYSAIGTWSGAIDSRLEIEWLVMSEDDFNRVEVVEDRVKLKVFELVRDYVLIMDCTSGTRPAGIAFYSLASRFKVPLVYVYEPEKKLIWLISRDMLKKELEGVYL